MPVMEHVRIHAVFAALAALCAVAQAEPRAKLTDTGGILVDGKPFLPVFVWAQPSSAIPLHKGLGVNTLHPGESDEKDPAKAYLDRLHAETMAFKDALFASDLPEAALEAVSANLSLMKTATVLRLEDGTLYGWEGCHANAGCCEGSCTHVWNYAQAFPFLFPALERSMRETNYRHNQDSDGGMRFRLQLPLGIGRSPFRPCCDGQFGDVVKTYRDWKVSGDDEWLKALWPAVRRSIEYAWSDANPDRWDPERTDVLHGRQHHTLDMELFGPTSWLTGFYLAALAAGGEMAERVGEADFAAECREVFKRGTGKGHMWGESSWILEDNVPMLGGLEKMRFWRYKTYRLYEKVIAG